MSKKIDAETVRVGFNDPNVVVHYARAAHVLGLWASERQMIERWLPDHEAPLLEVGCGAGRVTLGLWELGYRRLTAVDFADELLDQARGLAALRKAEAIRFLAADATRLRRCHLLVHMSHHLRRDQTHPALSRTPLQRGSRKRPIESPLERGVARPVLRRPGEGGSDGVCVSDLEENETLEVADKTPATGDKPTERTRFAGALFMFNGLMQIPGRENRRQALREIHAVCRPMAPFLFTTHDRDDEPRHRQYWTEEAARWARGVQDPRLVEFGDRCFLDEHGGYTFMHVPAHAEVREDLSATGWAPAFDAMRRAVASESSAVRDFSDECRFWVAHRE